MKGFCDLVLLLQLKQVAADSEELFWLQQYKMLKKLEVNKRQKTPWVKMYLKVMPDLDLGD